MIHSQLFARQFKKFKARSPFKTVYSWRRLIILKTYFFLNFGRNGPIVWMYGTILLVFIVIAYILLLPYPDMFSFISFKRTIFQLWNIMWTNMSFLAKPKSLKVYKKVEAIGLAPLTQVSVIVSLIVQSLWPCCKVYPRR